MHEWCSIYVLDGKQTPLVMLSVVWCSYAFMIYGSWAPYMLSLHAYVVFDILFSFSLHHLLIYTVGRATCAGRSSSLMKCTRCASSCRAFAYGWSMQSEPICTSRSLGGGRRMDERSRTSSKVPNAVAATVTRRLHLMRRTGRGRSTTGRFPWSHESKSDLHPDGPEPPLQPRVYVGRTTTSGLQPPTHTTAKPVGVLNSSKTTPPYSLQLHEPIKKSLTNGVFRSPKVCKKTSHHLSHHLSLFICIYTNSSTIQLIHLNLNTLISHFASMHEIASKKLMKSNSRLTKINSP
jgi:hypothetical protein